MSIILDIGCGETKKEESIGIDINKTSCVDIIADAYYLPIRDEIIDHVYSSHLIEHFRHRIVIKVERVGSHIEGQRSFRDTSPESSGEILLIFYQSFMDERK